jgi:hypothetical protein
LQFEGDSASMAGVMDRALLDSSIIDRMRLAMVTWHVPESDAAGLTLVAANCAARAVSGLEYAA